MKPVRKPARPIVYAVDVQAHPEAGPLRIERRSYRVAAMIAAAEAMSAKGTRTKRTRAPAEPDWWTAVTKGKTKIKHSLWVRFVDGEEVRVNAWQNAGKPIAIGWALSIAIAFRRQRNATTGGPAAYRDAVPALADVALIDGEAFDAAECSRLTEALRDWIATPQPEALEARIARLHAELEWWHGALRRAEEEARCVEARCSAVTVPPAGDRDRGTVLKRLEGWRGAAAADIRTAHRMVAQYERFLAEAEGRPTEVAPPATAPDPRDDVDAFAGAARVIYDTMIGPDYAGPTFDVVAASNAGRERALGLAKALGAEVVCDRWKETRVRVPLACLDRIRDRLPRGLRITGLPRKPRSRSAPVDFSHPDVRAARVRLDVLRASRPLPFPDRGRLYRTKVRVPAAVWEAMVVERRAERARAAERHTAKIIHLARKAPLPRLAAALTRTTPFTSPVVARAFC